MNNLHRELAPISQAAWVDLEQEARRTFARHAAGRRAVDVSEPKGDTFAAVGTGRSTRIDAPGHEGLQAGLRESLQVLELRVPFRVSRDAVDEVERGSRDADWQPVKDAAQRIAQAEDRAIVDGFEAAGITGIRAGSSHRPIPLPADVSGLPGAVAEGLAALRLAGVDGPHALLLGASEYTAAAGATEAGYPLIEHLQRILGGDVVWAPSISGGCLLSTRGGDHDLLLGQDLSIGYLSHDAEGIDLYFEESFAFLLNTPEAAIALAAGQDG
ncbi:family 1 encapsulin nanocompartment shell protein [Saccharopolyspora shandongensis]|uniref:Type 1 encapsulin shell protein n=1 Tax=Saccharopolyspora shandongensis TaxID=418495 RepID=A0A1H2ZWY1_9PSEU|nr:family 1 encapsulin nanocompartment shell protein [Saccharopolyspora shandongensis]SDX21408.1 Uncharacterized protein, linocin/CFP29 family [Saccharopolyspora shandongensis]